MAEKSEGTKAAKKHLHSIRTELVRDHKGKVTGSVSHHSYLEHPTHPHPGPETPRAVHNTPEEAGEHVTDQIAAEQGGAPAAAGAAPAPEEAQAGAADPGAAAGAPEAGM